MDKLGNINWTPEDNEAMRLLIERQNRLAEIMELHNTPLDEMPEAQLAEQHAIQEEMMRILGRYD